MTRIGWPSGPGGSQVARSVLLARRSDGLECFKKQGDWKARWKVTRNGGPGGLGGLGTYWGA